MTPLLFWTFAIGILTAMACAVCGTLLVVKREAFISEGLSHAVLPGIILAYIFIPDRSSLLLIFAAGLSGLIMVGLVQAIASTQLVHRDAALGIVFSALFSVGVIASATNLGNVHFHADCIIDGNLSLAALNEFQIGGRSLGPRAFATMALLFGILTCFIVTFYKELKLMAFDEATAKLMGFRPKLLHAAWLALVSMTTVAAFETAGTILVVALMIVPAATANLLTNRLPTMFVLGPLLGAAAAALGVWLGVALDISPAGPIATTSGILFLATTGIVKTVNR